MDRILVLVFSSHLILIGLGSGLTEMNEIFVNEIPAQEAVQHSATQGGSRHHHPHHHSSNDKGLEQGEKGTFSHDFSGEEEGISHSQESPSVSQNKHHSHHHTSHGHHTRGKTNDGEKEKGPMEEDHFRWSSGEKPPPAYGDETHGVYDLEIQPGDEDRIYHYDSKKLRPLDDEVKRWKYERQKGQSEGCGYPVCILLDGIPWRFKSLCDFIHHLDISNQDHIRRIFHIQKGDCADAIDGLGWKNHWKEKTASCHNCREDEYCNTKVCWVHDNHSTTYENICSLLSSLGHHTISGWIGIGECEGYFSRGSCINTEWFDIDHPCGVGDVEQARTNILYTQAFVKTGSTRMCSIQNIQGNMDVRTVEGGNVPSNQVIDLIGSSSHSYNGEQIICKNQRQTKKPEPPYFWPYDDVKCRDYKVRHCCRNLFGENIQHGYHNHSKPFKIVTPKVKTIFDDCEWKPFLSNSYPKEHEQEDRATLSKTGYKKHVCGSPIFNSMFIDARRRKDDIPFYETGEKMTKVTPTYGLLCSNVNNQYSKRNCSDYKVRFCCVKNAPASWGAWGEWSKCSKSCNSGYRKSKRQCKDNKHKHSCYGKQLRDFKERIETCNELPCSEDALLSEWRSWSPCSTTCGLGERRRTRTCDEGRYKGKSCPEEYNKYFQIEQCPKQLPCPVAIWAKWSFWSKCSSSCGYGVKRRTRNCIDLYTKKRLGTRMHCLGGSHFIDERCFPKKCTIDGGWTDWLNWEECNILCGKKGKRIRRRYCAKPIPSHGGKNCYGDKIQTGNCPKLEPCPIHCTWSNWGHWTKCSVTCGPIGYGYRERRRHIAVQANYGGSNCDKSTYLESENCPHCERHKSKDCIHHCPIDCEWSPWNFLGECLSCYHGDSPPPNLKEYPAKRIRFVKKQARYNGDECKTRGVTQEKNVHLDCSRVPKCPEAIGSAVWSQWSQWSSCKGICGGKYIKKRSRDCIPTKKESKCHGKSENTRECPNKCVELGWTEWNPWSECPVTCGKGKRIRKRECFDPNLEGKVPCKGRSKETAYCDCGPCSDKGYPIETEGHDFLAYITQKYGQDDHQNDRTNQQGNDYTKDIHNKHGPSHNVGESKGDDDKIKEFHHQDSPDLLNNELASHSGKSSDNVVENGSKEEYGNEESIKSNHNGEADEYQKSNTNENPLAHRDELNGSFSEENSTSVEENSRSGEDDLSNNDQPLSTPRNIGDNHTQEGKLHPSVNDSNDNLSTSENKFENQEQNANDYEDSPLGESGNDVQDGNKDDASYDGSTSNEVDISKLKKDDQPSRNISSSGESMDDYNNIDQIKKEEDSEEDNSNKKEPDLKNLKISSGTLVPVVFNEKSSSMDAEEDNESIIEEDEEELDTSSYTSDEITVRENTKNSDSVEL